MCTLLPKLPLPRGGPYYAIVAKRVFSSRAAAIAIGGNNTFLGHIASRRARFGFLVVVVLRLLPLLYLALFIRGLLNFKGYKQYTTNRCHRCVALRRWLQNQNWTHHYSRFHYFGPKLVPKAALFFLFSNKMYPFFHNSYFRCCFCCFFDCVVLVMPPNRIDFQFFRALDGSARADRVRR